MKRIARRISRKTGKRHGDDTKGNVYVILSSSLIVFLYLNIDLHS